MAEPGTDSWQLQRWLARIEEGDLSAREELLCSVGNRLERLAHNMLDRFPNVRRWADTNDVLQSSVVRLLRALREVRPASNREFFGLAAEQMRRELIDLARHFARATRAGLGHVGPLPNDSHLPASSAMSREDDAAELELWERFHEAVLQLPVMEREVFSLVFYHDWPHARMAEFFRVDERTIRRRWRSACIELQTRLKGRIPGDMSGDACNPQETQT